MYVSLEYYLVCKIVSFHLMSCSTQDFKTWIQETVLRFLYVIIIFILSSIPPRTAGIRFIVIRNLNFLKTSKIKEPTKILVLNFLKQQFFFLY